MSNLSIEPRRCNFHTYQSLHLYFFAWYCRKFARFALTALFAHQAAIGCLWYPTGYERLASIDLRVRRYSFEEKHTSESNRSLPDQLSSFSISFSPLPDFKIRPLIATLEIHAVCLYVCLSLFLCLSVPFASHTCSASSYSRCDRVVVQLGLP